MKKKIAAILLSITVSIVFSNVFSPVNKYSLSFEYLDSVSERARNTVPVFYSLPAEISTPEFLPAVQLGHKEQMLKIGSSFSGAGTSGNKGNGFGVITGTASYTSSFLKAYVQCNGYSLGGFDRIDPVESEYERFVSGKVPPISGMFDVDFTLPEAYMTLFYKELSLASGREKIRWGPGYKGTLAMSGIAYAPFYYYHLILGISDHVKMTSFLAGYDDERAFDSERRFIDSISIADSADQLPPRYGVGQRIDIRINDHFQFAIHELCDFYGANDLTRYADPLQVYYLGFNSGTNEANMLAGCDVNLFWNPIRIYGEILDDDITIFDNKGNPNKFALQLGTTYYGNGIPVEAGFEYTHLSIYIYGHYSVLNRHTFWDEPMGWPWGNDQDCFNIHSIFRIRDNIHLRTECSYWILGKGTVKDDWYYDNRPDLDVVPWWPDDASRAVSVLVEGKYQPYRFLSVNAALRPIFTNKKTSFSMMLNAILSAPVLLQKNL